MPSGNPAEDEQARLAKAAIRADPDGIPPHLIQPQEDGRNRLRPPHKKMATVARGHFLSLVQNP
jgi:hypothetical protein